MTRPLRTTIASEIGKVREHNEDFADHSKLFFAIADGVGGSPHGEIASLTVITEAMKIAGNMSSASVSIEEVTDAVFKAAASRMSRYQRTAFDGMATTLTTLAVARNHSHAIIGHVGDSRAYLLHHGSAGGDIMRITTDQSYRNVLHGVVSTDRTTSHTLYDVPLQSGDMLLLCTDGVTNEMTDSEIATLLHRHPNAEALIHHVVSKTPARDNATAVLVMIP